MYTSRNPALRHHVVSPAWTGRSIQRRWAHVHDVRFVATRGDLSSVVLEKYRAKLDRKAREEGLSSVNQLREAYKDKINSLRHQSPRLPTASPSPSPSPSSPTAASIRPYPPSPPIPNEQEHDPPSSVTNAKPPTSPISNSGPKPLSAYLDIPKVLNLPPRELEYIWRLRHASSPQSLCAVIPASTYNRIAETAQRHPQFILPLPREAPVPRDGQSTASVDGKGATAEIHFLQWTFPTATTSTVLFTHLAEYKLRGEYSQPHTTVTHHLDLRESNGVVLLRGDVVRGRGVSVEEGKWLLMCLQKFYGASRGDGGVQAEGVDVERKSSEEQEQGGGGESRRRLSLLEQFSHGAKEFNLQDLLDEAEKIS